MNVEIVDQVQAIENFTNNPLLRGIEDSDKVSLNLKLKKNLLDFSGEGSFGYAYENRHFADINALTITKTIKNFSTVTYNNLGENRSPHDYFSFLPSLEDNQNAELKAFKPISEQVFTSALDNQKAKINDNWFTNFNHIYNFSNRLNLRLNFSYYKDQLDFLKSNWSKYLFENGTDLTISQKENTIKKPEIYDGNLKLIWNSSKSSLLEFTSKWSNENIITRSDLRVNDQEDFWIKLHSKNFFTKQELLFTQKLNTNNVVQIKALFSRNEIPQNYSLNPGFEFLTGEIRPNLTNLQESNTSKNHWELSSTLLGARKKNKFQIAATTKFTEKKLTSFLYENQAFLGSEFQNDMSYKMLETNLQSFYNLRLGKLSIKPIFTLKNYWIGKKEFIQPISQTKSHWILSPELWISYTFDDRMKAYMTYSYDEIPPAENYLYSGYILTSNRSITRNSVCFKFQNLHTLNFGYEFHDLYNQFSFHSNFNYSEQKNQFFSDVQVAQNLTTLAYFLLPNGNRNYGVNLNVEKYIPFVQSTFKIGGNYFVSEYANIVNHSELRNNSLNLFTLDLYGKTAFDIPFNFQNELKFFKSNSKSGENGEIFQNTSINNRFKVLMKPNLFWFGMVSVDFFKPSFQNSKEYYFLDAMVQYKTPNKIWEFSIVGKNLTNNQTFQEIAISDYFQSVSTQSLNKAYFLVGMSFSY